METQQTELARKSIPFAINNNWWLFGLAIVVVKFLLLALDPLPKLFLGDSFSYIYTALSGYIPGDRSFFYGYVIRMVSVWTGSLTSLLIFQAFLGAIIALIVAWIARAIFELSNTLSYLFGFLCSIDPLQLVWERYVMTETCSLFLYALVLQQSFVYLRHRRIATLLAIQILSVILLGFRMTFLIVVQVMAVALPLVAFLAGGCAKLTTVDLWQLQFFKRGVFWWHLATSLFALFLLDQAYQYMYGFLSQREPAHLHSTGYQLLSAWAPALQPRDAPDPRLANIIEHGSEFGLRDFWLRENQLFRQGYLVDRWVRAEPDRRKSSKIALRTALNAIQRDPAAVIGLAAKTYFAYWTGPSIRKIAEADVVPWRDLKDFERKWLAQQFHWATRAEVGSEPQTLTQSYYVAASPYFFLVLLSPALSLALLLIARNKANALLLFVHTVVLLGTIFLVSLTQVTRYFQPLSFLTLLSLALATKSFVDRSKMGPGRK
jgi:hypothetical protein